MPPEYTIGYVMIAATVVLGAGFIYTALSARKGPDDYEPIHHAGYAVRRYWFVGVMCLGLIGFAFTLPHMANPQLTELFAAHAVQSGNDRGPIEPVADDHVASFIVEVFRLAAGIDGMAEQLRDLIVGPAWPLFVDLEAGDRRAGR